MGRHRSFAAKAFKRSLQITQERKQNSHIAKNQKHSDVLIEYINNQKENCIYIIYIYTLLIAV